MISKELFEVFTSIKESLTTDIVETFAGKKTSAKKIILHSLNFVQINQWRTGETGKSHLRQRFRRCVAKFLSMQYKVLSSFQELYWANSVMMSIPPFA